MHIVIPLNFGYITHKYGVSDSFLDFMRNFVVPDLVDRLSLDGRVDSIEVISDVDLEIEDSGSEKVRFTGYNIQTSLSSNEVAAEIMRVRRGKSPIIVQYNPLFPFVSVDSLWDAHSSVQEQVVQSSVGSFISKDLVEDIAVAMEHDLGIFNVYSQEGFNRERKRQAMPTKIVGLHAVELIGLRNSEDYSLFDLVINSGFEI